MKRKRMTVLPNKTTALQMKVSRYCDVGMVLPTFHEEAELIYVTKGSIDVRVNGKRFNVGENGFFLIMPNRLYEILYGPCVDFWMKSISQLDCPEFFRNCFSDNLTCASFECDNTDAMKYYSFCLNPVRVLEFRKVEYFEREEVLDNLICSEYSVSLRNVLRQCIDSGTAFREGTQEDAFINDMFDYISANYMNHTSAVKYSSVLGLSECAFRRRLKPVCNAMGYSYSYADFVNIRRTEQARRLLRTTDCSINEISKNSGFLNDTRFRRIFMKYSGVKPKQYRDYYNMLDRKDYFTDYSEYA